MIDRRIRKWIEYCETWAPTFHNLPTPGPVESASEAYVLSAAQRRGFTVNSFVKIMAMMPPQKRHELVARFYANGLRAFTQLAVIRFWTMERQRSEMRHPEAFRNRRSSWQGLGYEWWLESDDYEEEAAPVRKRPPKPKRTHSIVFDDSSSDSRSGSSTETEPVMVRKVSPQHPPSQVSRAIAKLPCKHWSFLQRWVPVSLIRRKRWIFRCRQLWRRLSVTSPAWYRR